MNRQFRSIAAILGILSVSACGESQETAGDGPQKADPARIQEIIETEKHDQTIALKGMEYILLQMQYTPDTFEEQQMEVIEQMTPTHRQAALDYLPTRVREVEETQRSVRVLLDPETAILGKRLWGDKVRAQLKIEGESIMTINGEKKDPSRTLYILNILVHDPDHLEYEMLGTRAPDPSDSPDSAG